MLAPGYNNKNIKHRNFSHTFNATLMALNFIFDTVDLTEI
jgi:hypothetical protein